jgi:hypothetical protein
MEARYGLANRIWVMDRGMMSAANIAWLKQTGRRYLIGTSKSELKKFDTVECKPDQRRAKRLSAYSERGDFSLRSMLSHATQKGSADLEPR